MNKSPCGGYGIGKVFRKFELVEKYLVSKKEIS